MWTYTTYIFGKYAERCPGGLAKSPELSFKDISDFVFDTLWRKQNLVFHDGEEDLYSDFVYLQNLGVLTLQGNENDINNVKIIIKDPETLMKLVKVVEDSGKLTKVKLLDEYKKKINEAVKESPPLCGSK